MIGKTVRGFLYFAAVLAAASAQAGFFLEEGTSPTAPAKPAVSDTTRQSPAAPVLEAKAKPVTCEFSVLEGDDTLEAAIKRWALASGWQAPQWNYRTVYVDYHSAFCGEGGFEGAVDRVMAAENSVGIPLFATFHSNRVVVIDGGK